MPESNDLEKQWRPRINVESVKPEDVPEPVALLAMRAEALERLRVAEAERTATGIENLHEAIGASPNSSQILSGDKTLANRLLGDFLGTAKRIDSRRLALASTDAAELVAPIASQVRERRFSAPSLGTGAPTATEYESHITNFSTRTAIHTLPDGRRVFSVYNYPLSQVHRWFDRIVKTMAGHKRYKVSSKRWKEKFQTKTNIPTFEHDRSDIILMPYIPNMNAYDVFRNNHSIENCGELPWVQDMSVEDKIIIAERIIDAIASGHSRDNAGWGETILQNAIITPEGEPIIVDPEVEFDADMSLEDQKVDDMREMIFSIAGAIYHADNVTDIEQIVHRLLARYPEPAVIEKLSATTNNSFGLLRRLQLQLHDLNYFGMTLESYKAVSQAISSYKAAKV